MSNICSERSCSPWMSLARFSKRNFQPGQWVELISMIDLTSFCLDVNLVGEMRNEILHKVNEVATRLAIKRKLYVISYKSHVKVLSFKWRRLPVLTSGGSCKKLKADQKFTWDSPGWDPPLFLGNWINSKLVLSNWINSKWKYGLWSLPHNKGWSVTM